MHKIMSLLSDIAMACFMVSLFANLAHWNGRRTESYVYAPPKGWLSALMIACGAAAGVTTLLWLLRFVPLHVAGFFAYAYFTALQGYSMWFRRHQRHASP
jgi:hypothetical protein